ncbi:flagellar biosynthesis protein FlgJ [Pseudoprimorskyibacter insulae]|uniref:Flagellar protein FlgJ N-terminal domain-containing protein n=1 Tax=Pseudoprimorskyibacter insulae TaxID=1695997 RepID=A0A2R8AZD4_9RHOB|nr:flagellar biosynthesis protein FlgJ [Pseudoprimorskyibacter insulae]SPF81204.1 hypothetical protein PRI8871_03026 [Pseudoprimorskyibacter insulae]
MKITSNVGQVVNSDRAIHNAAVKLEGQFLSEWLKAAGLHKAGPGSDSQFSSLLREKQAQYLSEAGGIGLAEVLVLSILRGSENVADK